jgi:spermidine synthase
MRVSRRSFAGGLVALGAARITPAHAQSQAYGGIARRESQYATTYVDRDGDYLTMRFGINRCLYTETKFNPDDPAELPITYTQYMTVALAYASQPSRIVEIGLGGGRLATYLHDFIPQSQVTCVELDPGVVDLARRFFGVRPGPRLQIVTVDGRVFMARAKEKFDIALIDAYQGTFVPFHMVTREFYDIVKKKLAPGGVLAQNIAPSVLDLERMIATANAVFEQVDLYFAGNSRVLIAYDGPAKSDGELNSRAEKLQQAFRLRYPLSQLLPERRAGVVSEKDPFTDDFAPVGYMALDQKCRAG